MIPGTYNLPTGYRGDTYGPIIFSFFNESGSGIPLDGVSGALQIREAEGYAPVIQWITSDSSMVITGNVVTLTPKPGECMRVMPGTYAYDLQLKSGESTQTLTKGNFVLLGDITQI